MGTTETKRDRLMPPPRSGHERLAEGKWQTILDYNQGYRAFADECKTERDCVAFAVKQASERGFREYGKRQKLQPGDKLCRTLMDKTVVLAAIGEEGAEKGANICAAHIDSPRLDLKPSPLYEDGGLGFLKTHYYGGIKKYQWHSLPLELRGVVYRADGSPVNIRLGCCDTDPVLVVTDLLPHFAADQMKKSVTEAFTAELLNALAGSIPDPEPGEGRVKLALLELLEQLYGIKEADFAAAELSLVPAGRMRDVGLDASMVGGYGHDDRTGAFAALSALFSLEKPARTAVCFLADKEEIGSEGLTGAQSAFFDSFMSDLCPSGSDALRRCYENSFCLSGDVCAAFDPGYPDVADAQNHARLGNGIGICKYTGRGGKGGASDASAQTMSKLLRILDGAGVIRQTAELGKPDKGGGGTVALFFARRGIETVDAGVPVLSMHSPFEVISKLDNYMAYEAAAAVYKS
ncbi:MAG: aminopeptidase [Oscillospiraceae bacterium]|jgi:aspartyl aminopeptidase|nr:aminopeptidase [Oscillospiraceae bacterium]